MHKTLCLLTACLLLLATSCAKRVPGYRIAANLNGFLDNANVVIANASTGKLIDSTVFKGSKFTSKGVVDESPASLSVIIKTAAGEVLYTILFIGNEDETILGSKVIFLTVYLLKALNTKSIKRN